MNWGLPLAAAWMLTATLPATAARAGDERQSLEDLLLKARERRAQAQAQVRTQLDALLAELAPSNRTPTPAEVASAVERIVRLGPEATPLLVTRIDAPDGATELEKLRAREVATALTKMDTSAITRELLELLASAGGDGKRNVLRVLATTPEPERARPAVVALFRSATGELKQTCLRALLKMGGGADDTLLTEVLQGTDESLIGLAIDALSAQRSAGAAEQVRRILQDGRLAQRHAASLIDYFKAQPALATPADVQAFARLAASSSVAVDSRVHVLDQLPALKPTLNAELKRLMEPLIGSPDRKLREAALVFLTRVGDKSARKELLKEYDELVAKNENWSESYVRRADMLGKIGEDDDAIKDYKLALTNGRNDPSINAETWVKLARAYTRRSKFKDAAETLRKSPLADAALKALADDPEFVPLRDSKYGKEAFGLR
jgi:tetratricopeptide (TPR) repeat protein